MRWVIVVGYSVAVLWLLFSLITFLYNYREVRRLDGEINRIRTEITVWKTDMLILKKGVKLEVKDSSRAVGHDDEGGGAGQGR